jgi:hypothetical protein
MRRRRRIALLAAVAAAAAIVAGCGGDDFENEPRPPAPIELTARIDNHKVAVAPAQRDGQEIGAGLANVTASNQTDEPVRLNFSGPNDQQTDPIVANGVLQFSLDLEEGAYFVDTDDASIRGTEFTVGPERPSAQNDLLLP